MVSFCKFCTNWTVPSFSDLLVDTLYQLLSMMAPQGGNQGQEFVFFSQLQILTIYLQKLNGKTDPQTSQVAGRRAHVQRLLMAIFILSCLVLQWSPGRASASILSPNQSTVLLPTFTPPLSFPAGLGMHRMSDRASVKTWLLSPFGPGRLDSQADDSLSQFNHAMLSLWFGLVSLKSATFITAPLNSSLFITSIFLLPLDESSLTFSTSTSKGP